MRIITKTMMRGRITSCSQATRRNTTTKGEEGCNWLDLPIDVLLLIFTKLGVVEILQNAQWVCRLWQQLSKEPFLFHSVIIRENETAKYSTKRRYERRFVYALAKEAMNRSRGQMVKFDCRDSLEPEFLYHIAYHPVAMRLRCLGMGDNFSALEVTLIDFIERAPMLEQIYLDRDIFTQEVIEKIGCCCQNLKFLRLHYRRGWFLKPDRYDEVAIGIGKTMPQLCRLDIIGGSLSNSGLEAILDGCPRLNYLNLRRCFNLKLEKGDLLRRCVSRIRTLIHPNGSTYMDNSNSNSSSDYEDYEEGSAAYYYQTPYDYLQGL